MSCPVSIPELPTSSPSGPSDRRYLQDVATAFPLLGRRSSAKSYVVHSFIIDISRPQPPSPLHRSMVAINNLSHITQTDRVVSRS